jgi:hypothetical protein
MKMNKFTLALAALVALSAPAMAQTTVADTDGDGVYSMAELVAAYPDLTEAVFAEIDVDANGAIDADELQAARENGVIAN